MGNDAVVEEAQRLLERLHWRPEEGAVVSGDYVAASLLPAYPDEELEAAEVAEGPARQVTVVASVFPTDGNVAAVSGLLLLVTNADRPQVVVVGRLDQRGQVVLHDLEPGPTRLQLVSPPRRRTSLSGRKRPPLRSLDELVPAVPVSGTMPGVAADAQAADWEKLLRSADGRLSGKLTRAARGTLRLHVRSAETSLDGAVVAVAISDDPPEAGTRRVLVPLAWNNSLGSCVGDVELNLASRELLFDFEEMAPEALTGEMAEVVGESVRAARFDRDRQAWRRLADRHPEIREAVVNALPEGNG